MMKNITKIFLCTGLACFTFVGCTDQFEEINTNPAGVTAEAFKADYQKIIQPLKNAQRNLLHYVDWEYQLQQNLNADIYSGYMMTPTPFNSNTNNANYYMMDGWNEWVLNIAYDNVMQEVENYKEFALDYSEADLSDANAMALTLKVIEMHKAADVFGPIIYTKYGKPNADLSVDYDSQKDAYNAFFKDLDEAATLIAPYASGSKTSGTAFTQADLIYGGNAKAWQKLINTLRLRLAIRISKVDAATAKVQGEKALNPASGGVITQNSDNALISYGSAHPIFNIVTAWDDIRSGAPLGAYLGGYKDPRLAKFMTPAADAAVKGQYIGIRNGIEIDAKNRYSSYSKPAALASSGDYFDGKAGKAKVTTAAEAAFLMAEAGILNWSNAGDVKSNYERGIALSFEEWGTGSAADYINNDVNKPAPYVDPKAVKAGANDILANSPYLGKLTVKWDAAASNDTKLERIATQKWIALYPDGQEAWSEFRRTGYPKLFPVVINNSNGVVTGFINRLPIPSKYKQNNKIGYEKAVSGMGGPDNANTRLWWDVN